VGHGLQSAADRALCGVDSPLLGFIADAGFATAWFPSSFLEEPRVGCGLTGSQKLRGFLQAFPIHIWNVSRLRACEAVPPGPETLTVESELSYASVGAHAALHFCRGRSNV
jgi:hypothetical protein